MHRSRSRSSGPAGSRSAPGPIGAMAQLKQNQRAIVRSLRPRATLDEDRPAWDVGAAACPNSRRKRVC